MIARFGALAMAVAGLFYVLVLSWLAWAFATSGSIVGIGMGAAVAVIAIFGGVFIVGEVRLGLAVQRMSAALSESLPGNDHAWVSLYESANEAALTGDRSLARRKFRQAAQAYRKKK